MFNTGLFTIGLQMKSQLQPLDAFCGLLMRLECILYVWVLLQTLLQELTALLKSLSWQDALSLKPPFLLSAFGFDFRPFGPHCMHLQENKTGF